MSQAKNAPMALLVEDDELIRMALALPLRNAGLGVIAVASADAAIDALTKGGNISVVITDVKMPGSIDGIGLARWMRAHSPNVPIVLVSGYPFTSDLAAINPAIAIIVKKPYEPDEVVGWVESLVHQPGVRGHERDTSAPDAT